MMEKKIDTILSVTGGCIAAILARVNTVELFEFIIYTAAGGLIGGLFKELSKVLFNFFHKAWKKRS